MYAGKALTAAEYADITEVEIKYGSIFISSDLNPELFDLITYAADLEFEVNIKELGLTAGRDEDCEIIIYSNQYPTFGRIAGPTLVLEVTEDALGSATLTDPLVNISLGDLHNVDTSGPIGDALIKIGADSYAMRTVSGGGGSANIDETLAADLSYSGPTSTITVGEDVVFGNHLYKNPSDGKYYKARANAITTAPVTRMALASASADATCLALCPGGVVRNDAWNWTADGTILGLYLSAAVAGDLAETPDTTSGYVGQQVALPLAANILEFLPSLATWRY